MNLKNRGQTVKKYWSRRVIIPSLIATMTLAIILIALVNYSTTSLEQSNLKTIAGTLAIVVADPMLIGDQLEVVKRISAVGAQNNLSINITDWKGNPIASYPPTFENEIPTNYDVKDVITSTDRRTIGYVAVGRTEPKFYFDTFLIIVASLFSFLGAFLLWMVRSARPIFEDIVSLESAEPQFWFEETKKTHETLQRQAQKLADNERERAVIDIARHVAHDIRSPLAALDSALGTFSDFPENRRQIIRSAVNRIRDIANGLLEKNREDAPTGVEVQLIFSLTDALATEKRVQYRSNVGVEIMTVFKTSAYGLFSRINSTEFKRVLSNLIDNSVEALDGQGIITVLLSGEADQVRISVSDNGKGISPEVLPKLGQKGATFNKIGGSGLGLYHAKTCVEQWGGRLNIQSEISRGTTVTISLPKATPPEWFISELHLQPGTAVIALDDDPAIQQVWRGRFESAGTQNKNIQDLHFSTPEEIRAWVKNNASIAYEAVFLMDYELLGFQETGLSLIEELKIANQAILVTSRYEEKNILEECLRLGVGMIPKSMVGFVPIQIVDKSSPNQIALIDDDQLVHLTWKTCARKAAVELISFHSPDEFESKHASIPKNTVIYIDSIFPNGVRGENYISRLRELGFTKITLTTGSDAQTPSLVATGCPVIGKEPPFNS